MRVVRLMLSREARACSGAVLMASSARSILPAAVLFGLQDGRRIDRSNIDISSLELIMLYGSMLPANIYKKTGWLNNPATRSISDVSLDYFFLAAFLLLFQAVASNITGVPMKRDA